jgi:hypothetical protein
MFFQQFLDDESACAAYLLGPQIEGPAGGR